MPGYLIADITVTDQEGFDAYRKEVPDTIAKYGGEYVIRGGVGEAVEGDWNPNRIVVLKFESLARAKEWYNSEEYQRIIGLRLDSSKGEIIFVDAP